MADYGGLMQLGDLARGLTEGAISLNEQSNKKKREQDALAQALKEKEEKSKFEREQFDYKKDHDQKQLDMEKYKAQLAASKKGEVDPLKQAMAEEKLAKIREAKLPTQGALSAKQFSDRMREAEGILGGIDEKSFKPSSMFRLPDAIVPEGLKSTGRKQYDTAVKSFGAGLLRKESGAAISDAEYANVEKTYFPQPGDSKEVIAQKAKLRSTELGNIEREAAPAVAYQQGKGLLDQPKQSAKPQDDAAKAWAEANPKDPRAAKILQKLGGTQNGIAR